MENSDFNISTEPQWIVVEPGIISWVGTKFEIQSDFYTAYTGVNNGEMSYYASQPLFYVLYQHRKLNCARTLSGAKRMAYHYAKDRMEMGLDP